MNIPALPLPLPWWRVTMVWLVIAGPASVVLACLVTAVFVWHGADRPLPTSAPAEAEAMSPATQARNHVVTPR